MLHSTRLGCRVAKKGVECWAKQNLGKPQFINKSSLSAASLNFGGNATDSGKCVRSLAISKFHSSGFLSASENEAAAHVERMSGPGAKGQPAPSRVEKTVNSITLMGRVGGDPQMRGTTEHPVVVFSIATHANYNYQSGEMMQKTDWHRVCVFKPYLRDTVYKYMNKGQRVYVTGRISYGEINDEQGKPHTTTSIIADEVIFISDSKNKTIDA